MSRTQQEHQLASELAASLAIAVGPHAEPCVCRQLLGACRASSPGGQRTEAHPARAAVRGRAEACDHAVHGSHATRATTPAQRRESLRNCRHHTTLGATA